MNPQGKGSRRNFLRLHSTVKKLRGMTAYDPPPRGGESRGPSSGEEDSSFLLEISRRAMATDFQVYLDAIRHKQDTEPALEALELVESLESQMTVYREYSEIMDINRRAATAPVMVEARLFGLLRLAVELYKETEGAFDITSGPLSKLWGFYRRSGQFPDQIALREVLTRIGTDAIELNDAKSTIRFLKRGMEINLNALGKGYALDRIAERLDESKLNNFLIHGGQSSILARGSREATDDPSELTGWRVTVRHPLKRNQRVAEIRLCNRSLGTSGTGTQFFHHKGRRYGHILDPRTGQPAEGVLSATVVAPSAALADALSTAFFVMGPEAVESFCKERPELSAVLVCPGQRSGAIDMRTFGFSESDFRRID
jgi:thiamine biosynthesis lipoprotein